VSEPAADRLASVDVVVVGAGLAGQHLGALLGEGGASVLLVDTGAEDEVFAHTGQASITLWEHSHRLVAAIGPEAAAGLLAFCAEGLDRLRQWGLLEEVGSLVAADGPREVDEVEADIAALQALGLPAERWSAADVQAATGSPHLGPARFLPGDGNVDPALLFAVLGERLARSGVVPIVGRVEAVGGKGVVLDGQPVRAEIVVLAEGLGALDREPFFADKVYPVRTQRRAFSLAPGVELPAGPAVLGQMGWLMGRSRGDALWMAGARWATPHCEVGERALEPAPAVAARLTEAAARWWPGLVGAPEEDRVGLMDFTCDGLPIVGALPGQPTLWSCLGMNGRPYNFALRCAEVVAAGILDRPDQAPALLNSRRFL